VIPFRPVVVLGSRQNYRPMPFEPVPISEKALGQTGFVAALGAVPMLALAGIAGVISWAGFNWASKSNDTAPKILGYAIGTLAGLSALGGVISAALWAGGVYAVKAAGEASAQQSAERTQQLNAEYQQSVQAHREQFMNQQPLTTEQAPLPMNMPAMPLPM
jgi:hypothetical protein